MQSYVNTSTKYFDRIGLVWKYDTCDQGTRIAYATYAFSLKELMKKH